MKTLEQKMALVGIPEGLKIGDRFRFGNPPGPGAALWEITELSAGTIKVRLVQE